MPYEQFKALRKQAGYTQVDVATILGINPTSITHWEQGRSLPTGATLVALSRIYQCSTDQLLGLEPLSQSGERVVLKG